ncbi:MAG: PLP-dependent transferase [Candidatus Aminicenantes bacterium]|nr:PLP-dependent transferase [Candidatus Aminicenantes bacterium]
MRLRKKSKGNSIKAQEDITEWKEKIDENTRFLYSESPSNPQQSFCDVKALVDSGDGRGTGRQGDAYSLLYLLNFEGYYFKIGMHAKN